jgi:hypothetical protein
VHLASWLGDSFVLAALLAAMLASRQPFPVTGVVVVYDENIDPFRAARDPASKVMMSPSKSAFGHEPTLSATFRRCSDAGVQHAASDR